MPPKIPGVSDNKGKPRAFMKRWGKVEHGPSRDLLQHAEADVEKMCAAQSVEAFHQVAAKLREEAKAQQGTGAAAQAAQVVAQAPPAQRAPAGQSSVAPAQGAAAVDTMQHARPQEYAAAADTMQHDGPRAAASAAEARHAARVAIGESTDSNSNSDSVCRYSKQDLEADYATLLTRYRALKQDAKDLMFAIAEADEEVADCAAPWYIKDVLNARALSPAPAKWWLESLDTRVARKLLKRDEAVKEASVAIESPKRVVLVRR